VILPTSRAAAFRTVNPPIKAEGNLAMTLMEQPNTGVANGVLEDAVTAFQTRLGSRLLAAYALGSLAHGGFSPHVSDVDLGLVIADPLGAGDADTVATVTAAVRAGGDALHRRQGRAPP